MITRFMTVYPGHIDMPDLGQDATPANERNYSNEQLVAVFDKLEAIAKQMDRFGWDTLWLAEHHFQREGYEVLPNLLMLAVHLLGDCRHPDQGSHRVRRRPRLPYARGRDLREPPAGPE